MESKTTQGPLRRTRNGKHSSINKEGVTADLRPEPPVCEMPAAIRARLNSPWSRRRNPRTK